MSTRVMTASSVANEFAASILRTAEHQKRSSSAPNHTFQSIPPKPMRRKLSSASSPSTNSAWSAMNSSQSSPFTANDWIHFRMQQHSLGIISEVMVSLGVAILTIWIIQDAWTPMWATICIQLLFLWTMIYLPRMAIGRDVSFKSMKEVFSSWPRFVLDSRRKNSGGLSDGDERFLKSTPSSFVFLDRVAIWQTRPGVLETIQSPQIADAYLALTILSHGLLFFCRSSCPVELITICLAYISPYFCLLRRTRICVYLLLLVLSGGLGQIGPSILMSGTTPTWQFRYPFPATAMYTTAITVFFVFTLASLRTASLVVARNMIIMLHEAKNSRDSLWSRMSHEIRNPLFALLASSDCLSETKMTREQRRLVGNLRTSSAILYSLLDNILSFAKVKRGEWKLHWRPSNLSECIRQIVQEARPTAEKKGLKLEFQVEHSLPSPVLVDEAMIEEVVFSLLSNAIRYTDAGSVTVRVSLRRRSPETQNEAPILNAGRSTPFEFVISVEDSGVGISSENLQHVFEPFYQIHKERNIGLNGAGVGLFLVKSLVHLWGGTVAAYSQAGLGSTFSFSMPCMVPEDTCNVFQPPHDVVASDEVSKVAPATGRRWSRITLPPQLSSTHEGGLLYSSDADTFGSMLEFRRESSRSYSHSRSSSTSISVNSVPAQYAMEGSADNLRSPQTEDDMSSRKHRTDRSSFMQCKSPQEESRGFSRNAWTMDQLSSRRSTDPESPRVPSLARFGRRMSVSRPRMLREDQDSPISLSFAAPALPSLSTEASFPKKNAQLRDYVLEDVAKISPAATGNRSSSSAVSSASSVDNFADCSSVNSPAVSLGSKHELDGKESRKEVHVFIAEDQEMIAKLVAKFVSTCTIPSDLRVVTHVVDDGDALVLDIQNFVAHHKNVPCLIISDLHMPKVQGDQAILEIKDVCMQECHRSPFCVILTGDESEDTYRAGERCGADKVLIKPIRKNAVQEVLTSAIAQSRSFNQL
eukprot:ANDGO_06938.mRNA.1 Autoinducer 2 sensor kinase/phosphatase LuxQ